MTVRNIKAMSRIKDDMFSIQDMQHFMLVHLQKDRFQILTKIKMKPLEKAFYFHSNHQLAIIDYD